MVSSSSLRKEFSKFPIQKSMILVGKKEDEKVVGVPFSERNTYRNGVPIRERETYVSPTRGFTRYLIL